jgi:acyl-coenzyme A synthetase/AMP-(fatty) acid ligase
VESVLQELDNVAEVSVYGEPNPITGQIVCAQVTLCQPEPERAFTRRLKQFCRQRLEPRPEIIWRTERPVSQSPLSGGMLLQTASAAGWRSADGPQV